MKKVIFTATLVAVLAVVMGVFAMGQDKGKGKDKVKDTTPKMHTSSTGLKYIDMVVGTGDVAKSGKTVQMNYTGWLYVNGKRDKKFDSNMDHGSSPFTFELGAHKVIAGWDEGVEGMKVGGKRELIIPPNIGYGPQGTPGGPIPPNATLDFEVELVKVGK